MNNTLRKRSALRWRLAVAAAIGCMALDRYSFGFGGGESLGRSHMWQVAVASILVALLVAALISDLRAGSAITAGRTLLWLEISGYVVYNGVLLARDRLGRLLWNFEHTPIGLALLIIGLAMRLLALRGTANHDST